MSDIDKKTGVDLDDLKARLERYGKMTSEERILTDKIMLKLYYAYRKEESRPAEIAALFERFRRLTKFTSYPEDIIIYSPEESKKILSKYKPGTDREDKA